MPSYAQENIIPYTPKQMFDLVADIEKYPEFLPWCKAARIISEKDNIIIAELVISFKHITEKYTSEVSLNPHSSIDVRMTKGPFSHLTNNWRFMEHKQGVKIDFELEFAFKSKIINKLIGGLFAKATSKMSDAFMKRASDIYS